MIGPTPESTAELKRERAGIRLDQGADHPFDAPDDWDGRHEPPPKARDWSHAAARGVIADLCDRRAIKWGFADIDEDVRAEIVSSLAEIILLAHKESGS